MIQGIYCCITEENQNSSPNQSDNLIPQTKALDKVTTTAKNINLVKILTNKSKISIRCDFEVCRMLFNLLKESLCNNVLHFTGLKFININNTLLSQSTLKVKLHKVILKWQDFL